MNEASCPQYQAEAAPEGLITDPPRASALRDQALTPIEAAILFDKNLRVEIDRLVQAIRNEIRSSERTLSLRALQTAKHWLGEDLAILGAVNPYPNSKDRSNTIVDPTSDVYRPASDGTAVC